MLYVCVKIFLAEIIIQNDKDKKCDQPDQEELSGGCLGHLIDRSGVLLAPF